MRPPPIASAYLTPISLRWAAAVLEKLTWCSHSTDVTLEAVLRPDAANGGRFTAGAGSFS